jgi:hypothetical protein
MNKIWLQYDPAEPSAGTIPYVKTGR